MTTVIDPPAPALRRPQPAPARLGRPDVARVGAAGLRTRPVRAFLSALGIAIGIAAMIAVVGISTSSREDLNRQLAKLGTNLLRVAPGQSLFGMPSHLPNQAVAMIGRIEQVTSVTAVGDTGLNVYRNNHIPTGQTGSIVVEAACTDLYTRTRDSNDAIAAVRSVLARTANPEHPDEVNVSRPSDALAPSRPPTPR